MTAQSNSQNVKVGIEQGAGRMFVKSGGVLDIEPGGVLSQAGVPLKIARGQLTTVTAADTVVTVFRPSSPSSPYWSPIRPTIPSW